MPRSIFFIFICLFFLLLLPNGRSFIPVFLINEEPAVITKGHDHVALLMLIEFEHEGLRAFIEDSKDYAITYFVTPELLERSPLLVNTLKETRPLIGIYGSTAEAYENDATLLQQQLNTFNTLLDITPMYFITKDATYSNELLTLLSKQQMNAIAPTKSYSPSMTITKGQFISVKLHKDSNVHWKQLQRFLSKHPFTSIEETIFDATISSDNAP